MMFTPDECRAEHALTPRSTFKPIPTSWGHFGMLGLAPEDKHFIDRSLAEPLAIEL